MTIWAGKALYTAIYTTLSGDGTLMALIDDVYDGVPDNAALPYIRIGEFASTPFDDKTTDGTDILITLHAFSHSRDKETLHDITARVYNLLHDADLSVTGQELVLLRSDFNNIFEERTDNMTTYHAVMRFRALTREV